MAYYDATLAERVRAIKELQSSHFLPLKLIGDILEPSPSAKVRDDRLAELVPAIKQGQEESRKRRAAVPRRPARKTVADVLSTMELSKDELDHLAKLGLAEPRTPASGEPYYSEADLDLLEVIHETRVKGMGDLFPMSIIEPYVACVRALVRVELELFRERVLDGAELPKKPLPDVAREATALGERLIVAMRSKLVFPELGQLTVPPKKS